MRKNVLRVLSCFLVVVALSLSLFPVQVVATEYTSVESFWNWVASSGDVAQGILSHVPIGSRDNVCANSADGYHHSNGFTNNKNTEDGYFVCVCKDCGREFKGYVSDIPSAYDTYVESLPFPGYTSSGGLVWQPTCDDVSEINISNQSGTWNVLSDCVQSSSNISFTYNVESRPDLLYSFVYVIKNLPVSGMYRYVEPLIIRYRYLSGNAQVISGIINGKTVSWTRCGLSDIYACYSLSIRDANPFPYNAHVSFEFVIPALEVVPDSTVDFGSDTYSTTTRPTSITGGNYGIVGDNGQITKVEDNSTIVNETNNTYYNPATGTTVPITGWSYDYSDRSYKVTLESGDTSTITYGDEYIAIKEGDTVYNIYYLGDGSGSETPVDPPGPCEHTWTETSTTAPTCTLSGSKLSTCSKCQQTKTETVPALGHDWQVKQTVTTEYDETGQLTQQGYTIFECSRCHEQYKSTDGTIPPGGGSGTDPGEEGETIWDKLGKLIGAIGKGLIDVVEAVFGKILDALISLVEMMAEKIGVVVETILSMFDELPAIFNGFLAFLTALFPFLPPELMTILTFGVLAVVFIGIIKAVRR